MTALIIVCVNWKDKMACFLKPAISPLILHLSLIWKIFQSPQFYYITSVMQAEPIAGGRSVCEGKSAVGAGKALLHVCPGPAGGLLSLLRKGFDLSEAFVSSSTTWENSIYLEIEERAVCNDLPNAGFTTGTQKIFIAFPIFLYCRKGSRVPYWKIHFPLLPISLR